MRISHIASNMIEVQNGKFLILFSYNTPVAAFNEDTWQWYQSNQYFSKTTSSHINKWYKRHGRSFLNLTHIVSQTEIEAMTK